MYTVYSRLSLIRFSELQSPLYTCTGYFVWYGLLATCRSLLHKTLPEMRPPHYFVLISAGCPIDFYTYSIIRPDMTFWVWFGNLMIRYPAIGFKVEPRISRCHFLKCSHLTIAAKLLCKRIHVGLLKVVLPTQYIHMCISVSNYSSLYPVYFRLPVVYSLNCAFSPIIIMAR